MAYLAAVDSGGRTASYRPTTRGSHVKTRIKGGHNELVVSLPFTWSYTRILVLWCRLVHVRRRHHELWASHRGWAPRGLGCWWRRARASPERESRRHPEERERRNVIYYNTRWTGWQTWLGLGGLSHSKQSTYPLPYLTAGATLLLAAKRSYGVNATNEEPLFNVSNISVWSDAEQISRLRLRIPVQRKEPQEPWVAMGINVYLQKVKTYHSFSFQLNMGKEFLRFSSLKKSVIKLSGGKRLTCSHRIHYFSNKCYVALLYVYIVNSPVFAMYFK